MSRSATGPGAWTVLLPVGTVWLPPRRLGAGRQLRRAMAGQPAGSSLAVAAPPWTLARGSGPAGPAELRTYLAVRSGGRPVLIASQDRAVLRYVADSVLSVPPGTGPAISMAVTAGLRLLRLRSAWILAAVLRAGGVVLAGRSR